MMTDYIDVRQKKNCAVWLFRCFLQFYCASFLLQSRVWPKGFHLKSLMKKGYLKFFMMGYIKQIVVLILTAGSLSFVPLNRIIIVFPQKNSGCLFRKNKY
jgi:hypothetical protein